MRIFLLVSISLSFISSQAMDKQKNRGCANQVLSALACFLEYGGHQSLARYSHISQRYANGTVLRYEYRYGTPESLALQAKHLCLQQNGMQF